MIKCLHNIKLGRCLMLLLGVGCVGNASAYTVTLKTSNCANSITYTVADNTTHAIHAHPLEGYHFEQWNDGNTENPRTIVVTEDMSFTTTLVANEYEVTFNANGGEVSPESQGVTFDAAYGELPVPTRAGYSFDGWFTESEAGTQVESTSLYTVVGNQELFAHWTLNAYNMTVKSSNCEIPDTVLVASGESRVIEASASVGYHFKQWSDGNTDNPRTVVVTSDTAFVAEFEANSYLVTFDGNGGTTSSASLPYGKVYGTLPVPTRPAYVFVGWFTDPNGGTQVLSTTMMSTAADRTVYAHWIVNKYWLTVKASACENGVTRSFAGETVCNIEASPEEGYHFTKWNDGNTDNPRTITIMSDATYIAEFAKNIYIVNGEEHEYGEEVTLTAADKSCYHFTQWSDGNTDNPRTITVTGDATYTEVYEINQYMITFENEDGTELQQSNVNCGE